MKRTWTSLAILAAVALIANREELLAALQGGAASAPEPVSSVAKSEDSSGGEARVLRAFERRESDLWVELTGVVQKTLPDDNHGSRHQRLIVRLPSGHSLLVAHNIDLAPRVPAEKGDAIELRGEYEWNERGGVLHWTHDDPHPDGRRRGGWIRVRGRTYR